MKDELMITCVALVVVYYLAADLCLSSADCLSASVNGDHSGNGSRGPAAARLHTNNTLSLVVGSCVIHTVKVKR